MIAKKKSLIPFSATFLLLLLIACQPEQNTEAFNNKATQPADSVQAEVELPERNLPPLIYNKVFLIIGGQPSLQAKVSYSKRLASQVGEQYRVLNAAVANESPDMLQARLPALFNHEVKYVLLEVGADEQQNGWDTQQVAQKLASIRRAIEQSSTIEAVFLITTVPTYLPLIEQFANNHEKVKLLTLSEKDYTQEAWQAEVAEKVLEVVKVYR
jgi:hypothetical protein